MRLLLLSITLPCFVRDQTVSLESESKHFGNGSTIVCISTLKKHEGTVFFPYPEITL